MTQHTCDLTPKSRMVNMLLYTRGCGFIVFTTQKLSVKIDSSHLKPLVCLSQFSLNSRRGSGVLKFFKHNQKKKNQTCILWHVL